MFLFRRCRKRSVFLWCTSTLLFFFTWTFLTMLLLIAQEQYEDYDQSITTTEDSYIGHGIQVVVGHYNGKLPDGKRPNLTADELNANNFDPIDGYGEMGRPARLSPAEEIAIIDPTFSINQFNIKVSDRIALNRTLPDMRKSACRQLTYDLSTLPTTSVIIVYHNEAWSTLLRTVTSVIDRSPVELLKEIILVDDYSNRTFLGAPLDEYVAQLSTPVRIVRAQQRVGLIRARLMGAAQARGDVLTFLDSHCECTHGWLEPQLQRIKDDRRNVVCPVIDVINDRTFAYNKGIELFRGGFNWNLQFRWYGVPPKLIKGRSEKPAEPIASPTMAGGLFSIERAYFEELGAYDPHMDIWGGENLEISFRIWMCGGRVEILPCSHVGHVFRKASPHDFPDNGSSKILNANLVRVAEVWMDEWKHIFYKTAPQAQKMSLDMDVSDRVELRQRLKCKDFKWYLDEVYFDHFLPMPGDFFGRIRQVDNRQCLQVVNIANPLSTNNGRGRQVSIDDCADNFHKAQISQVSGVECISCTPKEAGKPQHTLAMKRCSLGFDMWQIWIMTPTGQIKSDEHQCLSANQVGAQWFPQLKECGEYPNEFWDYDKKRQTLIHRLSEMCLDQPGTKGKSDEVHMPTLKKCSRKYSSQLWTLKSVAWHPSMRTEDL